MSGINHINDKGDKKTESAGQEKLELIAIKEFINHPEMYKIIDYLNRSLRDHNLMFGLSKNKGTDSVNISIYKV